MRIGVDVMGGDHAPDEILKGALVALDDLAPGDVLCLVGDQHIIKPALRDVNGDVSRIEIVHASQHIDMHESPVEAVRSKPDSSINILASLGSKRKASKYDMEPLDAIFSAGNTGACVSAAQMQMRRLRNVHRPGIAVTVPTFSGPVVLIDVGANIEPKPHHLAQYGVMGEIYASRLLGIENPRVALMNVGGEEQKGTADMKEARDMLRDAGHVNFVGYIEGRAVFDGEADVVITDGVVGNVMIKLAEGLSAGIFRAIAREVAVEDPELAQRLQPVVKKIYAQHDYHEYGGAPLMGVNGICMIGHGSSEARTVINAIRRARMYIEAGVNEAIIDRLGAMEEAIA
jgi:glycerol-3-phosphate acyltransferase PlsX